MNDVQKQDEMKALADIVKKLDAMDEQERRRTMVFLNDKYGLSPRGTDASQPMAKPTLRSTT